MTSEGVLPTGVPSPWPIAAAGAVAGSKTCVTGLQTSRVTPATERVAPMLIVMSMIWSAVVKLGESAGSRGQPVA